MGESTTFFSHGEEASSDIYSEKLSYLILLLLMLVYDKK